MQHKQIGLLFALLSFSGITMALESTSHIVLQTPLNFKSDLKLDATGRRAIDIDRHWVVSKSYSTTKVERLKNVLTDNSSLLDLLLDPGPVPHRNERTRLWRGSIGSLWYYIILFFILIPPDTLCFLRVPALFPPVMVWTC